MINHTQTNIDTLINENKALKRPYTARTKKRTWKINRNSDRIHKKRQINIKVEEYILKRLKHRKDNRNITLTYGQIGRKLGYTYKQIRTSIEYQQGRKFITFNSFNDKKQNKKWYNLTPNDTQRPVDKPVDNL